MIPIPEETIQIVASDKEQALREAGDTIGASPLDLEIVGSEPVSKLPWQPKRFRFSIARKQKATETRDGVWEVDYTLGSVWLTVHRPVGAGRPVMPEDVLKERRRWPLPSFDYKRLYAAVEKAAGKPVAITEYEVPKGKPFGTLLTPNEMVAYLVLGDAHSGDDPVADAVAALTRDGVVHGIDLERVRAAVNDWKATRVFLVAEGTPPEVGEHAEIMSTDSPASPKIGTDGTLDISKCRFDEVVDAGDQLLVMRPARRGAEGTTVRGTPIPTTLGETRDLAPFAGSGVTLSEDGLQLLASIAGSLARLGDKINIVPALKVTGNAEPSGGDIDFAGNVIVAGDVADGVSIRADGDLTVKGVAHGARLDAGGVIVLASGMSGHGTGEIATKAYVEAPFLHDCTVRSEGNVVATEIVRSNVTTGDSVTAGQILGGVIQAQRLIAATTVGSLRGVSTRLVLVQPGPESAGASDPAAAATPVTGAQLASRPSIRIKDRIYSPAEIVIGHAKRIVDYEIPFTRFVESKGEVAAFPYS